MLADPFLTRPRRAPGSGVHAGDAVLPTMRQLARRALPQAVEASIIPAVVLLVLLNVASSTVAIAAALGWIVAASTTRALTCRRISGLTILSITRLTVRSIIAIAAGSAFVYFVQGSIGGLCMALAFLGSVLIDRPLARRFAGDFCDLQPHVLDHPRVHHALRRISLMWGLVGLAHAATGLWLLLTLSTNAYVVVNALVSVAVPATAITASVAWFRRAVLIP